MGKKLSFEIWDTNNAEDSAFFETLYLSSFPRDERREIDSLKALMLEDGRFVPYIIRREGKRVGFITFWRLEGFVYIEHFAVDPQLRGQGVGLLVLQEFILEASSSIVLEAEMPDEGIAGRRIGFYRRAGFRLHPAGYIQPPYDPSRNPVSLYLMSHGFDDMEVRFDDVVKQLHTEVYKCN